MKNTKFYCSYESDKHKGVLVEKWADSYENAALKFASDLGTLFWRCEEDSVTAAVWVWDENKKNRKMVGLSSSIKWKVDEVWEP